MFLGGLSLGAGHSLILQPDGAVWAAGANTFGQLGIKEIRATTHKQFVTVMFGGAKAVSAGGEHSMVLTHVGSVWTAGNNAYGQLGDGSTTHRDRFVQV